MYDNITITIPTTDIKEEELNQLPSLLSGTRITTDSQGEYNYCSGYLDNMRVYLKPSVLIIKGSISRFYYGEKGVGNLYPLNYHDTKLAIIKLSEKIGMDISQGDITSIEFGNCFAVGAPIFEYLKRLGDFPRLERVLTTSESLYYKHEGKNKLKELKFYNKIADCKNKKFEIPSQFDNMNLLKYELTLKGRANIMKTLGCQNSVKLIDLADKAFFNKMLKLYKDYFHKIHKLSCYYDSIDSKNSESVGNLMELLFSRLLNSDPNIISEFIEEVKRSQNPSYCTISKLKRKLTSIRDKSVHSQVDLILTELENEIENCGK